MRTPQYMTKETRDFILAVLFVIFFVVAVLGFAMAAMQ